MIELLQLWSLRGTVSPDLATLPIKCFIGVKSSASLFSIFFLLKFFLHPHHVAKPPQHQKQKVDILLDCSMSLHTVAPTGLLRWITVQIMTKASKIDTGLLDTIKIKFKRGAKSFEEEMASFWLSYLTSAHTIGQKFHIIKWWWIIAH